ncbi:zinc-binding dehydrogenase [Devosia sp. SL43]|nr:zinc-binding dehydrogenase [Devosia sp. SL43]
MKAVVIETPGGPEVLHLVERHVPKAQAGQVLIRVKAFGINRSELFTRQGHSPGVQFPRILGIEAVGVVEAASGGEFAAGDRVATVMGGMGRQFDGGYAEFTIVPARQVRRLHAELPWAVLGALPEMLQTAWGATFKALRLQAGDSFLVRGGTTSVGLAAIGLARQAGARVLATTRKADRSDLLREHGAHEVIVDDGSIAGRVREFVPGGVNKVLELVGTTTLPDSLQAIASGGVACMAGMVGDQWSIRDFAPMDVIPHLVSLTIYSGGVAEFMEMPLDDMAAAVANGTLRVPSGPVFHIDDVVEAHRCMEENRALGKIVITT